MIDRTLERDWIKVVGPPIDSVTRVEHITGGVLTVRTTSDEWVSLLSEMTDKILTRLHERGWRHVRRIEFVARWDEPEYEDEPGPWKPRPFRLSEDGTRFHRNDDGPTT